MCLLYHNNDNKLFAVLHKKKNEKIICVNKDDLTKQVQQKKCKRRGKFICGL
jgi:hypothetical protein